MPKFHDFLENFLDVRIRYLVITNRVMTLFGFAFWNGQSHVGGIKRDFPYSKIDELVEPEKTG